MIAPAFFSLLSFTRCMKVISAKQEDRIGPSSAWRSEKGALRSCSLPLAVDLLEEVCGSYSPWTRAPSSLLGRSPRSLEIPPPLAGVAVLFSAANLQSLAQPHG